MTEKEAEIDSVANLPDFGVVSSDDDDSSTPQTLQSNITAEDLLMEMKHK